MEKRNLRKVGRFYEVRAAEFLTEHGVKILFYNFCCRQGEIDLIGIDKNVLVFFEVKYRKDSRNGFPEEAVGITKQKRICRTSRYFIYRHPEFYGNEIRYDVVSILDNYVKWYRGAFTYTG